MLQGKTSSVFTLSLLLTLAAPTGLPAAFFTQLALAQSSPTSFPLPDSVPRGTTVRVDGSNSMAVINQALKQRFEAQYGGTTVNLATEGTDAALRAVLDGTIDLAAIGRPLTQAEKAQGLVEVPISREKIAIIVGPDNPFQGNLSFEQFARMFRGEITDWSQVGGTSGGIRFVDRPDSSDTRQALRNYKVFQVAPFATGSNATQVNQDSTAAVVAALGQDGISYAIASQVIDQPNVRVLRMHSTLPDDPRYPFSQPRGYVYKGTPNPAVQSFLGFATAPVGLATIAQAKATEAQAVAAGTAAPSPGTGSNATTGSVESAAGTAQPGGTASGALSAPGATAAPAGTTTGTAAGTTSGTIPGTTAGTSPNVAGTTGTAGSPTIGAATSPGAGNPATGTAGTAETTATGTIATNPAGPDGAATNPAADNRSGAGWLPWLLLPLAAIGGFLFWRSRRGSTATTAPPVTSPPPPTAPPAAPSTGTTLAQRTGSVVTADRLELMTDSAATATPRSAGVSASTPASVSPDAAVPPAAEIPPPVGELSEGAVHSPAAAAELPQLRETETTAIDPETVEEIPSAAIDPGIPGAAIDPTLLGGAALVAGTGALFGLSELHDRAETAEPPAIEPPLETAEVSPEFAAIEPSVIVPPANADIASSPAIAESDAAIDPGFAPTELPEPALPLVPEATLPDLPIAPVPALEEPAASIEVPEIQPDELALMGLPPVVGAAEESTIAGSETELPETELPPAELPEAGIVQSGFVEVDPAIDILAEGTEPESIAAHIPAEISAEAGIGEPAILPEAEFPETEFPAAPIESVVSSNPPATEPAAPIGGVLPLAAMAAGAGLFAAAQSRGTSGDAADESYESQSEALQAIEPQPPISSPQLDEQSAIEAARFDVGQSDLSSEELATVDANLPDLPGGYGESQIVLLPRDPQWAYAYWDVPSDQKQAARQQGGSRFALRFYDVTNIDFTRHNPHSLQQYECDEMARNWYIPVPLSDRDYIAEIGYTTEDGGWMMLARSLPIRIPPVYPSDWDSQQFLTVDWQSDLRDKTFLELAPPGERKTFDNPIYDRIFGLTESAEAQRVAGSLYGSMQQVPQQAVSSFASGAGLAARTESGMGMSGVGMSGVGMSGVGMYSMSGIGMSGVGMSALSESGIGMMSGVGMYSMSGIGMVSGAGAMGMSGIGMSGIGMSGVGMYPGLYTMSGVGYTMSGIGMSGVGFSASMPPMRPRRFWLVADAELIVYGATEPDATVTIAGRPVQLNPDGTFRFQMSFQDGMIDFPILAVAADGEQTRSVHLNFERQTPSRNTNTKEEAKDEWFPG